jgi:hypothetical protein
MFQAILQAIQMCDNIDNKKPEQSIRSINV